MTASGFQKLEQTGISVNPGDTRNLSALTLTVGSSSEEVTAQAAIGEMVPEDSGERSALLTANDIQRLTIQSRNISELLKILPGPASPTRLATQRDGPPSA